MNLPHIRPLRHVVLGCLVTWLPITSGAADFLEPPGAWLADPPTRPALPAAAPETVAADPMITAALTPPGGFEVDLGVRQQARAFFNSVFWGTSDIDSGWSGDVGTCDAGTTSAAFRENVIARVNFYRAMAGVPSDLTVDDTASAKAQEAALIMSANDSLSHNPPSSWDCWTLAGAEGAENSNLAWGSHGAEAVSGYMRDSGSNNAAVGHRRWILYPQTQWMGTGDIPPQPGYAETNVLWVFDDNPWGPRPTVRDDFVAWPPPGYVAYNIVPVRWSFSYPEADFSRARVSMTSGGQPVSLTLEPTTNGFGENTLVWVPDGLDPDAWNAAWPQPLSDTRYQVSVSDVRIGGVPTDFSYEVIVIDPQTAGTGEEEPLLDGSSVVPAGQPATFAFDPVSFADTHEVLSAVAIPYATLLGAETATGDIIDGTNIDYALRDSNVSATGAYSYHLAHTSASLQYFELEGAFLVEPGATVDFDSRLGYASENQVARLDVSVDEGTSWNALYSQAGTSSSGDIAFVARQVDLDAYAGKTVRLRFAYAYQGGLHYTGTSPGTGFYVDDVQLSGLSKLVDQEIQTISGDNSFTFSSAAPGDYLLQVRAVPWEGFPALEWGEAFRVTVSDVISWVRNDLTGDHKSDLVLRNMDSGYVFMWEMDGGIRTYRDIGRLPLNRKIVGIGDVTGDGMADIVIRNSDTGYLYMWAMNGGLKTYHGISPLPLNRKVVGVADVNGDGRSDIVLRNTDSGYLYRWEIVDGIKTYRAISRLALNREVVGLADLTGDGRVEIVIRNLDTGYLYFWDLAGGEKTYYGISRLPLDREVIGLADVTGDGKADVVLRNRSSGYLYMWAMQGDQKTYHPLGALPLNHKPVQISDVTGDGTADIILRNLDGGHIYVWEMDSGQPVQNGITGVLPLSHVTQPDVN